MQCDALLSGDGTEVAVVDLAACLYGLEMLATSKCST